MSRLTLICVPFHLGVRSVAMGRGPLELLEAHALADRLREAGHDVEVIELLDPREIHEIARVFEVDRELARKVTAVRRSGRLPLVLGGNCNVSLGALAGFDAPTPGIVWLDAHADFHTPDTTVSGFFDGMALAIATGACWHGLARSIPGFHPVAEQDTILVGARDIDSGERERLQHSAVTVIDPGGGPGGLALDRLDRAITNMAVRVDAVYLHIDLDSIDVSLGHANEYATAGGLGIEDIRAVTGAIASRVPIGAASFTAYDPDADTDGRFGLTAVRAIGATVKALFTATERATE